MNEVELSGEMKDKAVALGEGGVLYAYRDGNSIRMETMTGQDPYVWRDGDWRRMTLQDG